jgi:hypothetical protein
VSCKSLVTCKQAVASQLWGLETGEEAAFRIACCCYCCSMFNQEPRAQQRTKDEGTASQQPTTAFPRGALFVYSIFHPIGLGELRLRSAVLRSDPLAGVRLLPGRGLSTIYRRPIPSTAGTCPLPAARCPLPAVRSSLSVVPTPLLSLRCSKLHCTWVGVAPFNTRKSDPSAIDCGYFDVAMTLHS